MAAHSAPVWVALRARVPRGFADFWRIMRELDRCPGTFTISDIEGETNVQRQSVEHYVQRLVAGGFADVVSCGREHVYRLVKKPKAAPRLRPDGSEIESPTAQECLWRAMRSLKQFTTRELAFAATTETLIPLKTAQRYVNELARAGYLVAQGIACRPATYRLKPGMNTGPLPPSILVTEAVWDRNLQKIVGEPAASFDGDPS